LRGLTPSGVLAAQHHLPQGTIMAAAKPNNGYFTLEMVQRTIKYFSDPKNADEKDPKAMRTLVADFIKFEQVVERGLLMSDARQLAQDFVVYGQDWLKKNKLEKTYAELKK
jgi:hypothetical protein